MPRQLTNEAIIATEVWLVDECGADVGLMTREQALSVARSRGSDLVQENIFSSPPRCRLQRAGTRPDRESRDARLAGDSPPKEIRISTAMGAHDVETRRRQAAALLGKGYRVKLSARLAKAERARPVAARALLERLARDLADQGRPAGKPFGESGALSLLLVPRED